MNKSLVALLLACVSPSAPGSSTPNAEEHSNAYAEAEILARCAGMLEFAGIVAERAGQALIAADAHRQSDHWRTAAMGALHAAGRRGESLGDTAQALYVEALNGWMKKLESESNSAPAELSREMDFCLKFDQTGKAYRRLYNNSVKP